ncbi:hypothetical protein [Burkholderia cenocepacia]|uniref:hypothetical protein n=1 Tax=Burkholderia cenocepacia TaxID=95486 RepID=UPI000F5AAEF3|nr:hypothetical protein [Burkholderia cenocepacia]
MGEALMVGKQKTNRKNGQKFSDWCDELFPGMSKNEPADAIWLAENWIQISQSLGKALTHPTAIRAEFKGVGVTAPDPEVDLSSSPAPRQRLTIETARKVNKLVSMAQSGEGQEQETAKKYLKKQAEKFGMKPDELSELARKTDPMRGIDLFWFVVYHAPARGLYSGFLKPHSRSTRAQTAHHTGPHNPAFGGFLCAVLPPFFTY